MRWARPRTQVGRCCLGARCAQIRARASPSRRSGGQCRRKVAVDDEFLVVRAGQRTLQKRRGAVFVRGGGG